MSRSALQRKHLSVATTHHQKRPAEVIHLAERRPLEESTLPSEAASCDFEAFMQRYGMHAGGYFE